MTYDRFPIMAKRYGQKLGYVPIEFMWRHEEQVRRNHGQTVQTLHDRGGLAPQEALDAVQDKRWGSNESLSYETAWADLKALVLVDHPGWDFTE